MTFAKIMGTGQYLPEKIITNHDLESMVDTTDEWITERTGIKERHVVTTESTTDLAFAAAEHAIAAAQCAATEIDLIIVATCTPDKHLPSTACLVQHRLGIQGIPAFDISAACGGFNYALSIADQFIRQGGVKSALVIGAETMSRIVDWTDRTTCILFADGAGAVVLGASDSPGLYSSHIHADGQYHHLLYADNTFGGQQASPYIKMQGSEVFKVAVNTLGKAVQEALQANNMTSQDVSWLIPHQANFRIIQAVAKKLSLPMERVIITLDKQGNTSAASVPIALDTAVRDGRVQRGDILLLESFGGGFTWGSALIKY